jgi:hypothetical protein
MLIRISLLVALLISLNVSAQNLFIVDQQATNLVEGGASIQDGPPMGQSFTPAFSSIEFLRLNLYDADPFQQLGGTLTV